MSKRHHVIAFVLLSSSAALASPAETDDDGFPLVGNMHGKRSKPVSRVTRLARAQQAAAIAARSELAQFVETRFQTLKDSDGYPLVGNVTKTSSDDDERMLYTGSSLPGDATAFATVIAANTAEPLENFPR